MAGSFLTNAERFRLESAPSDISRPDLVQYFTLSNVDLEQIPCTSQPYNRLGFALQLCLLRYLGFFPANLVTIQQEAVQYLANQLDVATDVGIHRYGMREATRTFHQRQILQYAGFRKFDVSGRTNLSMWLAARALEHDKPALLIQLTFERLIMDKILRPGITIIEKMVGQARNSATQYTFDALQPIVNVHQQFLDNLLVPDKGLAQTTIQWLKSCSSSNSAAAINESLKKLALLYKYNVHKWDVSAILPNRLRHLRELAKKSTNQALSRSKPERRYPILIAFLRLTVDRLNDEIIDMFDHYLLRRYGRAKKSLDDHRQMVAKSTNEKLQLFQMVGDIILNKEIDDQDVRKSVFDIIPRDTLHDALINAKAISRPLGRVKMWRGGTDRDPYSVSTSCSSNRTCAASASGFRPKSTFSLSPLQPLSLAA